MRAFSRAGSICAVTFGLAGLVFSQTPGAFAIKDAHVFTGSAELPKATVVLRDGLVEAVGSGIAIPADAWVIDGAGLNVYPGFIDALSTWGIPPNTAEEEQDHAPARANGPEDRPQTYAYERAADLASPTDPRLEAARAAGFTTAATYPNRGIFEGLGAMLQLAGAHGRDMVVAQPIGQQIVLRTGSFRAGFPNSLMGDIAYIRQMYLDVDHYRQARQTYAAHTVGLRRPGYDHALEALSESPRMLLPADEIQQIDRMLAFGAELHQPFVLYGLHEAFERVDQLKQAGNPVLVSLKWPEKPKGGDPNAVPNYRDLVMRQQAPAVPAMLSKAGVKFAFFSDGVDKAPDLRKALKKAINAGLSPADAVRALTLSPAEIYGLSDRLGSIDKGKIANLIVCKGDVFDDKSMIQYVFIDGQELQPPDDVQHPKEAK